MFLCVEIEKMVNPLEAGFQADNIRIFIRKTIGGLRPTEIHVHSSRGCIMARIPVSTLKDVEKHIRNGAEWYKQAVKEIVIDADFDECHEAMLEVWKEDDRREKEESELDGGEWVSPSRRPALILA